MRKPWQGLRGPLGRLLGRRPSGGQEPGRKGELLDVFEAKYGRDLPALFAVISWGCTATRWVAAVLNSHPHIFAVHHLRAHLRLAVPTVDSFDDRLYLRMLRHVGTGYALAGDVHGVSVSSIPTLRETFGEDFRAAAVVRHPEKRLLSQVRLFEDFAYSEAAWSGLEYLRSLNGFPAVAHYYRDVEKRFYIHAANMLNNVLAESRSCRLFRFEDITTDPAALTALLEHIAGDRAKVTPEFVHAALTRPALNSHPGRGGPGRRLDQPWQIEVIRAVVQPQAIELYRRLGYELPESWAFGGN